MSFKKPFKAVPIQPKRLKGIEEFDKPLVRNSDRTAPINWLLVTIGLLSGACLGLAYLLWLA